MRHAVLPPVLKLPLLIILGFVAIPRTSLAQSAADAASRHQEWEMLFRTWMSQEDADYGEETFELLAEYSEQPFNLNTITREQMMRLPFLSAQQIEDIQAYVDRYKPLRSLNELTMITSLDPDTRRLFQCFVVIGESQPAASPYPSLAQLRDYGRHTLQATLKVPTYERKGDRNGYLGYRYRHDIRYQFSYRDQLKFGITGAQDAGEPFFSSNRWGYDFYAYYFQLRSKGRLEALNLGMFRVQMGMGLIMNTGFHLGKLALLQSLGRSSRVLTAHASRSSASYLRGAAATWRFTDNWRLTAFASYRPLDATLNDDGSVRTIVTDGYHRTQSEFLKKNNTHATDFGARVAYQPTLKDGIAHLNLNVVYSRFDRMLLPFTEATQQSGSQLYRRYALAGNGFFNASVDYGFTNHRFSLTGETAVNRDVAFATIHSLSYRLSDAWALMLLHRYYDKRYTACHAHSFSEGSSTQNEHGVYVGVSWNPSRTLHMQAYLDYAYFPWMRYQVSAPSQALDATLLTRTYIYSDAPVEIRYRFRLRQRDNEEHTLLQNRYEHRLRLRLSFPLIAEASSTALATPSEATSLALATQADAVFIDNRASRSRGILLSQQAHFSHRWIKLNASIGWFHTDDYDSRLYQYEPSVRYDFSFPAYYGHGLRYAFMARADIGRFSFSAKVATTNYFDRAVISSGLQQIDRSSMTDILLQLRCQF